MYRHDIDANCSLWCSFTRKDKKKHKSFTTCTGGKSCYFYQLGMLYMVIHREKYWWYNLENSLKHKYLNRKRYEIWLFVYNPESNPWNTNISIESGTESVLYLCIWTCFVFVYMHVLCNSMCTWTCFMFVYIHVSILCMCTWTCFMFVYIHVSVLCLCIWMYFMLVYMHVYALCLSICMYLFYVCVYESLLCLYTWTCFMFVYMHVSVKKFFVNVWRKSIFDIYVTEYGTALTTILPILFLYLNTVTAGTFEP
jgi:hypothetical protein